MRTYHEHKLESNFSRGPFVARESDRAALAASLFHSLDTEIDDDAGEHWDAEIKRRLDEIDNGSVELISWAKVKEELSKIRNG